MTMKLTLVGLLVCALGVSARVTAQGQSPPATPCNTVKDIQVICGQQGPEDLVVLPGANWIIASSMTGTGGLNAIRVSDRMSVRVWPSPAAKTHLDAKTYAGCPGAPGATFTTHGLSLESGGPVSRLFVVGHGGRESIEIFTVDTRGSTPVLTWVGCAVAPDPIGLNSVRGLPDGGFIASNFLARNVTAEQRQKFFAGEKNGELWEWHSASRWHKVPGSEAAGANGLEMSNDGKWLYVDAWASQSFFRLSRGSTAVMRRDIPLGFRVDNVRRARDGSLIATGQGEQSTDIVRIDPNTLAVTKLVHRPDDASFRSGTVAVEVGDRLWVGSFQGDRIAILPAR